MPHDGAKSAALDDTDPRARRVQLDLLRKMGPERRIALMRSMTTSVLEAIRRDIQKLFPGATDSEVSRRFIERLYGRELAQRVCAYLDKAGG